MHMIFLGQLNVCKQILVVIHKVSVAITAKNRRSLYMRVYIYIPISRQIVWLNYRGSILLIVIATTLRRVPERQIDYTDPRL